MSEKSDIEMLETSSIASSDNNPAREYNFLFDQLSDKILETNFHYLSAGGHSDIDSNTAALNEALAFDEEGSAEDKELSEFLNSIFAHIDSWSRVVEQRWQRASNIRILNDFRTHIKMLSRLLRNNRYPRLALIGRRGAGKSSLINALLGEMVAQPGHIKAQTGKAKVLLYRTSDGVGLDVVDTRGLNEGGKPEEEDTAETATDSIVEALNACPVDAVLFIHKIKEVDSAIDSDIKALQEVFNRVNLLSAAPVIVALTHADEVEPSDLKRSSDFDEEKLSNIEDAKQKFLKNLNIIAPVLGKKVVGIEAISCAVIWDKPTEDGRIFPNPKRDYRYNVDKLLDLLLRNVQIQAVFKTVQACRISRVKNEFANFLIRIFASIAALLAFTPIPGSDIIPLTAIISYQTYTIAKLSSSQISMTTISRFLGVVGMTGVVGYGARYLFGQMLKFFMIPGAGVGGAVMSYSLVVATGKSAIAFFLDNKSEDEVRKIFENTKKSEQMGNPVSEIIEEIDAPS